jgi:hypothetical protein
MFGDKPQAFGKLTIDENKIYIVRRKADGRDYKIFHDGREELIEQIAEQATEAKEK